MMGKKKKTPPECSRVERGVKRYTPGGFAFSPFPLYTPVSNQKKKKNVTYVCYKLVNIWKSAPRFGFGVGVGVIASLVFGGGGVFWKCGVGVWLEFNLGCWFRGKVQLLIFLPFCWLIGMEIDDDGFSPPSHPKFFFEDLIR